MVIEEQVSLISNENCTTTAQTPRSSQTEVLEMIETKKVRIGIAE